MPIINNIPNIKSVNGINFPSGGGGISGWLLTNPFDIPVGASEGDYGLWNNSGRVLTTLSRPSGSDIQLWLPNEVASGTPIVRSWFAGNESTGSWAAQGGAAVSTGGAVITTDVSGSGWTRFDSTSGSSRAAYFQVVTGSWAVASVKVYCVCQTKAESTGDNTTGTFAYPYWFRISSVADEITITQNGITGFVQARDARLGIPIIGSPGEPTQNLRNGGSVFPNLASSGEFTEIIDSSKSGNCTVLRNGLNYLSSRRSPLGAVSNFIGAGVSHSSIAAGSTQCDLKNWHFITY
jgi:hypothetical protein